MKTAAQAPSMLSHLRLSSFRNYRAAEVAFSPGWNVVLGANGQGKSNLLEAVCYLAVLRSLRTRLIDSLRHWESDQFSVDGVVVRPGEAGQPQQRSQLRVTYGQTRKLLLDGYPVARASEFIHQFPCLAMIPEDLFLVKGSGKERRRYLDMLLSQLVPPYLNHLQSFTAALKSRNAMLRQAARYGQALTAYDGQIAHHGAYVTTKRRHCVRQLDAALRQKSGILLRGRHGHLSLKFVSGSGRNEDEKRDEKAIEADLLEVLGKGLDRDIAEGRTRSGPHRDDFAVLLGARPAAEFASDGEARSASLGLRLASLDLLTSQRADAGGVVLLLDDVVGELDEQRRRDFFDMIKGPEQVIVTTTVEYPELSDRASAIFYVAAGEISRRNL